MKGTGDWKSSQPIGGSQGRGQGGRVRSREQGTPQSDKDTGGQANICGDGIGEQNGGGATQAHLREDRTKLLLELLLRGRLSVVDVAHERVAALLGRHGAVCAGPVPACPQQPLAPPAPSASHEGGVRWGSAALSFLAMNDTGEPPR